MDLTASHTVMITKGLLDYTKNEEPTKIDTTAFLANLKLHTEDSRMKKELNFSMHQNTNSEKKINFNDFIKRLKTRKSNASCTGPDKENSEISIHSKESNRTSSIHQMHESRHVDETDNNVTRIFREQDDEMDFTHCHTANIQSLVPASSEASLREFKSDDITVYGSDLMDLTRNHTIQILPSADNLSEIENQTHGVMMDVTTGYRTKASEKKRVFENKPNAAFQDSSLNLKGELHITRSNITGTGTHTVTQTSNQDIRTLAMIPGSICSSPAIQDYKTFLYSSCNNAMELTDCLSNAKREKNSLKHDSNYGKIYPNPDANSLIEKTIYSGEDSMDITKSHTVAIDNQIFKQDQTDVQIAIPISEKEMMLQNHITVSKNKELNVNCNSVPDVSRERLKEGLANPLSISLTGKKNVIFTGEDTDLTKSHKTNLGSQAPPAFYNLESEDINKSHSDRIGLLNESEKMTKSHIELSQQPNIISKNFLTDTWRREKDQVLEISPYLDKVSPQSVNINQDSAKSNIVYSGGDLNKQVALGNNRNTVSCEQSMFPTTKLFSSEGQCAAENHTTAIDSHIVKSVSGQNSKLPEPLRKSLGNPALDCCHDKTIICSEEQNMDLTKSHTVVIGFGPSEVQELGKTNLENSIKHETVKVERYNKTPIEKSGVFIFNDMDTSEDKCVQKPGFLNENQDVKICERKSIDRLKIDKTVIFSEGDENDMDITKSYTLEINHRPLLDEPDSHLVPLAGTSKTVLYACGQDDMEVTRSHTTAIECETVSTDEVTTKPVDKTVMFIGNHDELEMTKSHTVFIDYQAKERTVLVDRPNFELSKKKSLGKPTVTPHAEESVFFPENVKSDHSAAKVSQRTLGEWSNNSGPIEKAVAVIANGNIEVSTSTIWKSDKDVPKPRFLNEPLSDISQRRKSLRLKNDKSIALSSNDKNDMDIIQSCTVEINNKSALEGREDSLLVPLSGTSKTDFYTCGQDDMEITRSHTTALEYETVSPVKITSKPMQNTVMFVENHRDLEVTKSHNAFIDCQTTEKILQECSNFGTAKGKTLGVSFPKDDSSVQEITEKQAQAVENKIVLHTEQKHHVIAYSNTFSGDQGEREIVKFHSTAVDEKEKDRGEVADQAHTMKKAKLESCHLSSTARRNVGFTNSHAPAICESSNNYSCLPNVISYFDSLEGNVMSLRDKDEKTSNCPVQNDLAYTNDLASEYYLKSEGPLLSAPCSLLEKGKATQTNTKGQSDCVITLPKDQNLIKKPPNLLANQTLVYGQDLRNMTKLDTKQVSLKFPEYQMEAFVHNTEHSLKQTFVDDVCIGSQPHLSTQLSPLPQQVQSVVNKDESKTLNIVIRNSSIPAEELSKNTSIMLGNEEQFTVACEEELKKNIQRAKCNIAIDFHSNSDLTKQVVQTHANPKETLDPVIASNTASFNSGKPNLNLGVQTVPIPPVPEQLLELVNNADNDMSRMQATEICNTNTVSNNIKDDRDEENKFFHNGSETNSLPLMTFVKEKARRCSLGIFLPRLPNKRNCSVTSIDDLEQVPSDTTDLNHLETQLVTNKDLGTGFIAAKLNLSPSQYINEENLPLYPGEINSSDSISIETEEKSLVKTYEKEISTPENKMKETCNSQKRTWVQEDDDDIPNEKKIRKKEIKCTDSAQDQEVSSDLN